MFPADQLKTQNQNKIKLVAISVSVALLFLVAAFLFFNRSPIPSYHISLSPKEAIFDVAPVQARANICGAISGGFYDQICDNKFDNIFKNDDEKLAQLFSLIQNVKEDNTISDYDRYYLANLLLVSLPTKDSSISSVSEMLKMAGELIQRAATAAAFAKEPAPNTNVRNFDEQMARDIVSTVYDLPKGDNALVINIMVSKHAWVDGRREPIYSEQYTESFNPFPVNPSVMPENITYHLKSFINSNSLSGNEWRPNIHEGISVMMAYSFSIQSWYSQGAGHDDAAPETNLKSRKNFSENEYDGTGHMDELMAILERVEQNPSSSKVAQRRNDALNARKNYKKSAKVETRPGAYESPQSDPKSLEDAYFGFSDGLMPKACEAILAKMPAWKREKNSDGGVVPHYWEEYIKDGKNVGGITDLGTCSTNIIFEEREREDMQIVVRGFGVTRERNEEYQKVPIDSKYAGDFFRPTTVEEIYDKEKKDWVELDRNKYAKKNEFTDLIGDKGYVSTYYFDSGDDMPDPSIDSQSQILTGKCVVSFYGSGWPIQDGDLYAEYITGPRGRSLLKKQGRFSGLFGKYHYYEYDYDEGGGSIGQRTINVHPGFDHGFQELHQKMISFAPQIVEAVKPFCGNTPPEL